MVSIAAAQNEAHVQLTAGLSVEDAARVMDALAFVKPIYKGTAVATEQDRFDFSLGVASTLALLESDAETRIAALLFELPAIDLEAAGTIE